ncbi:MAG: DUF3604 domain-containing protein [Halioglobus sp.]
MAKKGFLWLAFILFAAIMYTWSVGSAVFYDDPLPGAPIAVERPETSVTTSENAQRRLLFGDLHVHTSYSVDAALTDTPASKGTPYTTPADACDFARYCSALDFWSINDHAEGLTPWQWDATRDAIRQCDAVTDANNPDMVSFLGWEWTHGPKDGSPATHWGHKNVIFRDTAESQVPRRAIASRDLFRAPSQLPAAIRGLAWLAMSRLDLEQYQSLAKHIQTLGEMEDCGDGDVRALANDCFETAPTPNALFEKLDQWGFDALVIPHGMAWGNTNPEGADFKYQMDQLNDKYQKLLEVYSGHGNSETFSDITIPLLSDSQCPAPTKGYTSCCWRAGEIIRDRCIANGNNNDKNNDKTPNTCDDKAAATRALYMDNRTVESQLSPARDVVPDSTPDEWGHCDQVVGQFQPSYYYQPKQSAQYMLTLSNPEQRYRPGFIGSSDNHSARPGSSYKETERLYFTDVKEHLNTQPLINRPSSRDDEPRSLSKLTLFPDSEDLSGSFYYTGGLVALYSESKTREDIWDALYRREVYGTSGPRIGLHFEMIDGNGQHHPMGSETKTRQAPRFRISGMGSLKQQPGCPDYAVQALGKERLAALCRNECYHPAEEAHAIERLEIVKVLPAVAGEIAGQIAGQEETADLIKDPWRVAYCEKAATQCEAEFVDTAFVREGREAAYYARVIQTATPTIQGDPLQCELDEEGRCTKTQLCLNEGQDNDCLSMAEQRAWSSPIYVEYFVDHSVDNPVDGKQQ